MADFHVNDSVLRTMNTFFIGALTPNTVLDMNTHKWERSNKHTLEEGPGREVGSTQNCTIRKGKGKIDLVCDQAIWQSKLEWKGLFVCSQFFLMILEFH